MDWTNLHIGGLITGGALAVSCLLVYLTLRVKGQLPEGDEEDRDD